MFRLMSAIVAAALFALAGCANQFGAAGGSPATPTDTWNSPYPEQPGDNRWGVPARA